MHRNKVKMMYAGLDLREIPVERLIQDIGRLGFAVMINYNDDDGYSLEVYLDTYKGRVVGHSIINSKHVINASCRRMLQPALVDVVSYLLKLRVLTCDHCGEKYAVHDSIRDDSCPYVDCPTNREDSNEV